MSKKKIDRSKRSKIVTKKIRKPYPKIIVKDLPLSPKYYRVTGIVVNKKKYFIIHHDEESFFSAYNRLKRAYHFTNQDVNILGTKSHRYASTTFIAKGFIP